MTTQKVSEELYSTQFVKNPQRYLNIMTCVLMYSDARATVVLIRVGCFTMLMKSHNSTFMIVCIVYIINTIRTH